MVRACFAYLMRQSFVLKRAVVAATQACLGENLNTCALPFEDQGLTAIAARIAAGTGCENTDLADWQEFIPFPENHCAPLIADILADEGVVPLNTDVPCDSDGSACVALAQQQRVLWAKAVIELENGPLQDPTVHETIRAINRDCRQYDISNQTDNIRVGFEKAALCEADGMARLWQDLTANP